MFVFLIIFSERRNDQRASNNFEKYLVQDIHQLEIWYIFHFGRIYNQKIQTVLRK